MERRVRIDERELEEDGRFARASHEPLPEQLRRREPPGSRAPPTRRRTHRAGDTVRDPRGRWGGSHGAERRAKRRRDTKRRGGGPEQHDMTLPSYLDGHPMSERAQEPTTRRKSTA